MVGRLKDKLSRFASLRADPVQRLSIDVFIDGPSVVLIHWTFLLGQFAGLSRPSTELRRPKPPISLMRSCYLD